MYTRRPHFVGLLGLYRPLKPIVGYFRQQKCFHFGRNIFGILVSYGPPTFELCLYEIPNQPILVNATSNKYEKRRFARKDIYI